MKTPLSLALLILTYGAAYAQRFEYAWGGMPGAAGSAKPYAPTTAIGPATPAATLGSPVL